MDWSCRLLHGQPWQPFKWNYFPLLTGRIVLLNKKRNLRKYSVVFFKPFYKTRVCGGSYTTTFNHKKQKKKVENIHTLRLRRTNIHLSELDMDFLFLLVYCRQHHHSGCSAMAWVSSAKNQLNFINLSIEYAYIFNTVSIGIIQVIAQFVTSELSLVVKFVGKVFMLRHFSLSTFELKVIRSFTPRHLIQQAHVSNFAQWHCY